MHVHVLLYSTSNFISDKKNGVQIWRPGRHIPENPLHSPDLLAITRLAPSRYLPLTAAKEIRKTKRARGLGRGVRVQQIREATGDESGPFHCYLWNVDKI